jgi:dihydrodipicolinate synthase/N-acetylneuraminate lyase
VVWSFRSFQGVISACLTPNGRYRERIPELVDFHLKHGVRGFFVLGTTGESVKLSREERAEVAETAVEYVGSRGLVIIHAGAADLSSAKWLVSLYHLRESCQPARWSLLRGF